MNSIDDSGIQFPIANCDLEIAFFRHGSGEDDPYFERTLLFAKPFEGFSLFGVGGVLTLWRGQRDYAGNLEASRMRLSQCEAAAWADRHAPGARYWVTIVGDKLREEGMRLASV